MAIKFLNKGNSKSIPNIFMQEIEPSIKNGIWLKSSQTFNNLIITDKNPLKVDIDEIKNIKVMETLKEGKTLYTR